MSETSIRGKRQDKVFFNAQRDNSDLSYYRHGRHACTPTVLGSFDSVYIQKYLAHILLYRNTSLMKNCPPPQDHYRTLGIVML